MNLNSGTHLRLLQRAILVGLSFCFSAAHGQLTRPGNPLPLYYPGLKNPAIYEFSVSEQEKKQAAGISEDPRLKPARSGMMIETDYHPGNSGTWDTLSDGMRVWRIAFRVKDARLLNLLLKPFHAEPGVKIFLYDSLQQNTLGAFTDLNNNPTRVLATGFIPGDLLILELQVPFYIKKDILITVAGIGCDFAEKSGLKQLKDGWFGQSGYCNVDINCNTDPSVQLVKNAVVRIVFLGDERCTGTLLNNTHADGRNYILTARHCINNESEANTALFYFTYESPYCSGPDGSNSHSVSGATIRATSDKMDFTLLELLDHVPVIFHPYYAGWDNTASAPSSAYSIHHPQGDVKKISIETEPLTITSFGRDFDSNKHWLVKHWETGTTEAGSSGGGIFDARNHLRGSLTGGEAVCGNAINDYFQMFSHDWKDYPLPENQLAYWLDPLNLKVNTLEGFDPNAAFWESGDTLSNIGEEENLSLQKTALTWGSWSGHNSSHTTEFAEHFVHTQKERVLGIMLNVAHNYVASAASHMVLKIWRDEKTPGSVIYQKSIPLADMWPNTVQFIEFDTIVPVADSFFAGYELFYDSPVDTFSTFMAANRPVDTLNSSFVYNNNQWISLNELSMGLIRSSFAIMPVVFDSVAATNHVPFVEKIRLYPNPADQYCWLEFNEVIESPVHLTLYNLQGQKIEEHDYGPYQRSIRIETSSLGVGIYLIRADQENITNTAKLLIIR
jgi:lysyl endopeptidase